MQRHREINFLWKSFLSKEKVQLLCKYFKTINNKQTKTANNATTKNTTINQLQSECLKTINKQQTAQQLQKIQQTIQQHQ